MKVRHLRFFVAVVETGSVSGAAQQLHISQPAVSAGLKALEDELGAALFDRSGGRHRMRPTAKAHRFLHDAIDILQRCDAAFVAFRGGETSLATWRIGVLPTISAATVAAVHRQLQPATAPLWKWREGSAPQLLRWLRQGRIDIAWTVLDADFAESLVLWREPIVVLAGRDHRLAQREHMTVRDLHGERLVLRSSCELRASELQAAGIRLPIAARAERDALALQLAAAGCGLVVAPRSLAIAETVPLPISDLRLERTIGLRWRPHTDPDALAILRNAIQQAASLPTLT